MKRVNSKSEPLLNEMKTTNMNIDCEVRALSVNESTQPSPGRRNGTPVWSVGGGWDGVPEPSRISRNEVQALLHLPLCALFHLPATSHPGNKAATSALPIASAIRACAPVQAGKRARSIDLVTRNSNPVQGDATGVPFVHGGKAACSLRRGKAPKVGVSCAPVVSRTAMESWSGGPQVEGY
jgi:hypothetical protein